MSPAESSFDCPANLLILADSTESVSPNKIIKLNELGRSRITVRTTGSVIFTLYVQKSSIQFQFLHFGLFLAKPWELGSIKLGTNKFLFVRMILEISEAEQRKVHFKILAFAQQN